MIPRSPSPRLAGLDSLEEVTELAAPVAKAAERLRLVTEAAEAQKAQAGRELRRALLHLGCNVTLDVRQRDELARVLYWGHPDIPVRDIVVALGFADQRSMLAAAGPADTGIACERCAAPLLAKSRSGLVDIQKSGGRRWNRYGVTTACDACRDALDRASAMAWEAEASGMAPDEPWYEPDEPWPGDDEWIDPAA
jgi:hypothetical protein